MNNTTNGPRHAASQSYDARRLVYIVMGLSNSGKSTKVAELVDKAKLKGIKCAVLNRDKYLDKTLYHDPTEVLLAEDWCRVDFLTALEDPTIRRIFIDNNNLEADFRQYYIDLCESRDIEWCILRVGKFTNEFATECLKVHGGGSAGHIDWAEYRRQLQMWGEYYQQKIADIQLLEAKGYEQVRTMSDTRLIATRSTSSGREVVLGITGDGNYIRAYIFKDDELGLKLFKTALNVTQWVNKDDAKLTIGRRYNGSFM